MVPDQSSLVLRTAALPRPSIQLLPGGPSGPCDALGAGALGAGPCDALEAEALGARPSAMLNSVQHSPPAAKRLRLDCSHVLPVGCSPQPSTSQRPSPWGDMKVEVVEVEDDEEIDEDGGDDVEEVPPPLPSHAAPSAKAPPWGNVFEKVLNVRRPGSEGGAGTEGAAGRGGGAGADGDAGEGLHPTPPGERHSQGSSQEESQRVGRQSGGSRGVDSQRAGQASLGSMDKMHEGKCAADGFVEVGGHMGSELPARASVLRLSRRAIQCSVLLSGPAIRVVSSPGDKSLPVFELQDVRRESISSVYVDGAGSSEGALLQPMTVSWCRQSRAVQAPVEPLVCLVRTRAGQRELVCGGAGSSVLAWPVTGAGLGEAFTIRVCEDRVMAVAVYEGLLFSIAGRALSIFEVDVRHSASSQSAVQWRGETSVGTHGAPGEVVALAVLGGWLYCGDDKGILHRWDITPLMETVEFIGSEEWEHAHEGSITSLVSAGEYMISAGVDGCMKVWAPSQPAPVAELRDAHGGQAVTSLARTSRGMLISGGDDGCLRLWAMEPPFTSLGPPLPLSRSVPVMTISVCPLLDTVGPSNSPNHDLVVAGTAGGELFVLQAEGSPGPTGMLPQISQGNILKHDPAPSSGATTHTTNSTDGAASKSTDRANSDGTTSRSSDGAYSNLSDSAGNLVPSSSPVADEPALAHDTAIHCVGGDTRGLAKQPVWGGSRGPGKSPSKDGSLSANELLQGSLGSPPAANKEVHTRSGRRVRPCRMSLPSNPPQVRPPRKPKADTVNGMLQPAATRVGLHMPMPGPSGEGSGSLQAVGGSGQAPNGGGEMVLHRIDPARLQNLECGPMPPPPPSADLVVAQQRVRETKKLFNDLRLKHIKTEDARVANEPGKSRRPDMVAGQEMRDNDQTINDPYQIGEILGVRVGERFESRWEMMMVGLHAHPQAGISFTWYDGCRLQEHVQNGVKGPFRVATCVVKSGGYKDDVDGGEVCEYIGSGKNNFRGGRNQVDDQSFSNPFNNALVNSCDFKLPVRLVRGLEDHNSWSGRVYVYDGLYHVMSYDMKLGADEKWVCRFILNRMEGQDPLSSGTVKFMGTSLSKKLRAKEREHVICDDISNGQEQLPVRVVNEVDDDKTLPPSFKYIARAHHRGLAKVPAQGCKCKGTCMPGSCSCLEKNRSKGEKKADHVYSRDKRIYYGNKAGVIECGKACSCGPKCQNRVTQRGIAKRVEVFKAPGKGWGLRARDSFSPGDFVIEYTGRVITSEEAEQRDDTYLYDLDCLQTASGQGGRHARENIMGLRVSQGQGPGVRSEEGLEVPDVQYVLDAREEGSAARFMNHSCEPNCFVQCVFDDHHDPHLARVMLFALESIGPEDELTYDYGYAIKSRRIRCRCGAAKCTGWLL